MRSVLVWVLPCLLAFSTVAASQDAGHTLILRGGRLFDGTGDALVPNQGLVVRGGVFQAVGHEGELEGARVVELDETDTILPGLFDLHGHFAVDLFGRGRVDETEHYPRLFLGSGVTTVFTAGEMNPDEMAALRERVDTGQETGPRILTSGPYFGSWRPGWRHAMTEDALRAEVDHWVKRGARGFKAKGLRAHHLAALIDQVHRHGLTVTGHLDSGFHKSVNPRDAIAMGIDRVEHFLGGDALTADRPAYDSLEDLDVSRPEVASIIRTFIERGVYFDATLSAYGYWAGRDPEVYAYWTDEREYFTPWFQEELAGRDPRKSIEQFEKIYWKKRETLLAFRDAGGAHLITTGSDHPSWGEFVSGTGIHRELHCFVLAGLSAAEALRCATINGARAMGLGDRLGTIEPGKLADLVIVRGDPLEDIRATRNTRLVMVAGRLHDAQELLESCKGKIGPANASEVERWCPRGR